MFYEILKNILFSFEPENAHKLVSQILKITNQFPFNLLEKSILTYDSDKIKINLWNIEFPNFVGLAAGFDKTGELYESLSLMGFGFIECGTFTPLPQEGNPKPRLFRYPEFKAIINRMGFNNPGIEKAIEIFKKQTKSIPRGINIGKNKITPNEKALDDYIKCFEALYPYADYMVVNVSSPNTPNLRELQESTLILDLIRYINKRKKELELSLPLLIKLAPDLEEKQFYSIIEDYMECKIDGLILTNTTIQRPKGLENAEQGGLSGLPLKDIATNWIKRAYKFTEGKIPIIGVGGIFSGEDALEKIMAGASLIQIYTGYIYEGPFLPKRILKYVDHFLKKEQTTLDEIIGINV
ncbi:MAG: dihydroorotate dehydrogenase (quinone) [Leptospiraceae bacterium]|nr:MAG: dihydroorotate dehydrogenase (quinone) [Leptospiraceae bacterium]